VPDTPYRVERRAALLSERITQRRQTLRDAYSPPGQRPPFTQTLSRRDALTWWRQHRSDDVGKQVLDRMSPNDIMNLDLALAKANEVEQFGQDMGVWGQ